MKRKALLMVVVILSLASIASAINFKIKGTVFLNDDPWNHCEIKMSISTDNVNYNQIDSIVNDGTDYVWVRDIYQRYVKVTVVWKNMNNVPIHQEERVYDMLEYNTDFYHVYGFFYYTTFLSSSRISN